jgi:hypothetical protein
MTTDSLKIDSIKEFLSTISLFLVYLGDKAGGFARQSDVF